MPLSWKHFVIATRAGQRQDARDMLKIYEPTLMAQTEKDARVEWEETLRSQAGQR